MTDKKIQTLNYAEVKKNDSDALVAAWLADGNKVTVVAEQTKNEKLGYNKGVTAK